MLFRSRSFLDPEGEFLKPGGSFERVVRPYIVLRLHAEMEGEGVAFATSASLSVDERIGGFFDHLIANNPAVSEYELRDAVEEGMLLYLYDVRERRYRTRRAEIEDLVQQEEMHLTSLGISDEERAEQVTLYREALAESLENEVRSDESRHFVFNIDPANLPESEDGTTVAERLIQERYENQATGGFRLPWERDEQEGMSIEAFAQARLRPRFSVRVQERLRDGSPMDGPFSFDDLEGMSTSTDLESARREFVEHFAKAVEPVRRVNAAFAAETRTDAELKRKYDERREDIAFYLRFASHEEYYRDYVCHWRYESSSRVPGTHAEFISLVARWAEEGYPTLIDETAFARFQEAASGRALGRGAQGIGGNLFREPDRLEAPTLEVPLSTLGANIPGYLQQEGTLLLSSSGYQHHLRLMREREEERAREQRDLLLGGRRTFVHDLLPSFPLDPNVGTVPLRARAGDERIPDFHAMTELRDRSDLLALTPEELPVFLREMNGEDALAPLVLRLEPRGTSHTPESGVLVVREGFSPLREYLLRSRLFITITPEAASS